jgi:superfamily II DNA or RNA helicase
VGKLIFTSFSKGGINVKLVQHGKMVRIYSQYKVDTVVKLKSIPGSRFGKDLVGSYWDIPASELPLLLGRFDLSAGSLYPHCARLINPKQFFGVQAEVKHDRIKINGPKAQELAKSIYDLCSYEQKDHKEVTIESLAEKIYDKDVIVVKFPPGLYWRVVGFLKVFDMDLTIHPYPEKPKSNSMPISVAGRHYQQKAVNRILNGQVPNRATLVMATGAGKTIMSAMITGALGLNTIFYTYSTDLLDQTAAVYEKIFNQPIGKIGGKYFDIQPITIATVQTIHSSLERQDERWQVLSAYLDSVNLMFVDEGHMLGADTIFTVAQATNSYYSYALTATPQREDGKELLIEAGTGPVRKIISDQELEEQGYILPVEVHFVPVKYAPYKSKQYSTQYKKTIVNNNYRNQVIASFVREDKQTIILVKEIQHGEKLSQLTGIPFIHGNSKQRKEILELFSNKKIPAIIASPILKQGVDIPEAEVLILAHGGNSLVEILQKIGRVRRPAPGKEKGVVIDFYDHCDHPEDVFRAQAERRWALYNANNFKIIGHFNNNTQSLVNPAN